MSEHQLLREEIRCYKIMVRDHREHLRECVTQKEYECTTRSLNRIKVILEQHEVLLEKKTRGPGLNGTTSSAEK